MPEGVEEPSHLRRLPGRARAQSLTLSCIVKLIVLYASYTAMGPAKLLSH